MYTVYKCSMCHGIFESYDKCQSHEIDCSARQAELVESRRQLISIRESDKKRASSIPVVMRKACPSDTACSDDCDYCTITQNSLPVPSRATPGSVGFDLKADISEPLTLRHDTVTKIPTGLRIAIPVGFYGKIEPRSSAINDGIVVHSGTIDSDYRGEVKIQATSLFDKIPVVVEPGNRIAQLVIGPYHTGTLRLVDKLDDTSRGTDGFGSSGK